MIRSAPRPIRLIARLDVKGANLIKGLRFEGLRVVGSPNQKSRQYYLDGADELIYLDAVASLYDRNHLGNLLSDVVKDVFVPITVGGGIRSVEDAKALLRAGADKIAINTAAVRSPNLIRDIAQNFGSQCVVLSIEAKRVSGQNWEVYVDGGREKTGISVFDWVEEGLSLGAGEVLLTSVDHDGVEKGTDTQLYQRVAALSTVPVIASGGIGTTSHARELLTSSAVDALAIGSALHYGRLTLPLLRADLRSQGIGVRSYEETKGLSG